MTITNERRQELVKLAKQKADEILEFDNDNFEDLTEIRFYLAGKPMQDCTDDELGWIKENVTFSINAYCNEEEIKEVNSWE